MMAPKREYGRETFELPGRRPPARRPANVYRERMLERRRQVELEQRRMQEEARARRRWTACVVLAAGLVVLCGMHIYQGSVATRNAARMTALKDEIHELTMDAETYECLIAEAASQDKIEAGAKRLGMTYPTDGQVRVIDG